MSSVTLPRFLTFAIIAALAASTAASAQIQPQPPGPPAIGAPALAKAAQEPGFDPRLALPTINALQAMLALREREIDALKQDSHAMLAERAAAGEAREATLIDWLKKSQAETAVAVEKLKLAGEAPEAPAATPPPSATPAPAPAPTK